MIDEDTTQNDMPSCRILAVKVRGVREEKEDRKNAKTGNKVTLI